MRPIHLLSLAVLAHPLSACGVSPSAPAPATGGGGGESAAYQTRATAAPAKTLTVVGARHCVPLHTAHAFGTSPFTVTNVTTNAYNNTAAKLRFPSIAGVYKGAYGWKYARLTPENAATWGGDHGAPAPATFFDSKGGLADNSGQWVVTERIDGAPDTITTAVSAQTDVTTFDPARVAYADLGNVAGTWTLRAAWKDARVAATTFSSGCFVVYTRRDGQRDFAVVGPSAPVTIEARGWVYAFFVTESGETAPSDLKVGFYR